MERPKFIKEYLKKCRSIRKFSSKPIPMNVIKNCLSAAGSSPNGANMQPWRFVVITNPTIKQKIRMEAEKEERGFYENKVPKEWLEVLTPLGTDFNKPFLKNAPVLIAVFEQKYHLDSKGNKVKHYYTKESVLILVAGYPAENIKVPDIKKKELNVISMFV